MSSADESVENECGEPQILRFPDEGAHVCINSPCCIISHAPVQVAKDSAYGLANIPLSNNALQCTGNALQLHEMEPDDRFVAGLCECYWVAGYLLVCDRTMCGIVKKPCSFKIA